MQYPDARILIFSRVPRAGEVKTRLIPALGAQGASDFHAACLRHTVACAAGARLAPLELWLTPDTEEQGLRSLAADFDCGLQRQPAGDLGERMAHAARQGLAIADSVLLIGTDAPLLDGAYLGRALAQLRQGADVVMGPAEDGGYILLGLRSCCPDLFSGMPWGEAGVAALTRRRCAQSGLALAELPMLWDVDRPQDLLRLAAQGEARLAPLQAVLRQHLPRL